MTINKSSEEFTEVINGNYNKLEDLALNHRKIFINEEINKDTIFNTVYYIHKIIEQDDAEGTKDPIDIYINTVGGFCSEGFILVDLIEQLKKYNYEINTIVIGTAYSFGVILALMGTHRYCYPHCDYMCHTVSVYTAPTPLPDLKRTVERSEKMETMIKEYIMANTKITQDLWDEKISDGKDWFFDAEEALKYGFCHKIV